MTLITVSRILNSRKKCIEDGCKLTARYVGFDGKHAYSFCALHAALNYAGTFVKAMRFAGFEKNLRNK